MGTTELAGLYDLHAPVLFGLARRVTGSRQAAEEITQDVFLRLWRGGSAVDPSFDPERGSVRSWLCMVGHGLAVSWVRREVSPRDRLLRTHSAEDSGWMADQSPVEADVQTRSDAATARELLLALSVVQREALSLVYFDGLTHRELAQVLGIPVGTAKSRLHDSLRHLSQLQSSGAASDGNRSRSRDHRSTDDERAPHDAVERASLAEHLATLALCLAEGSMHPTLPARVIDLALTCIPGCENAGILISTAGALSTSASSHDVAVDVRELSRSLGEGPWSNDVRTCFSDDLVRDLRWPRFGPAAGQLGVRSLSLVLVRDGGTSVEFTTYSPTSGAFSVQDRVTAMVLASVASVAVRAAAGDGRLDQPADPLLRALDDRSRASTLLGTVMGGEGIGEPDAFHLLTSAVAKLSASLREPDPAACATDRPTSPRRSIASAPPQR
ncbi:MAG: RNA polymerase sigma factor [Euzebya sp.]